MASSRDLLELVREGEHGELTLLQETVDVIHASISGPASIEILSIFTDCFQNFASNAKAVVKHLHDFMSRPEVLFSNGDKIAVTFEEDTESFNKDNVLNMYCEYAEKILQVRSKVERCEPAAETVINKLVQAAAAVKQVAKNGEKVLTNYKGPVHGSGQLGYAASDYKTASNKQIFCWPQIVPVGGNGCTHLLLLFVDQKSILANSKMDAFVNKVSSFRIYLQFQDTAPEQIQNLIFANECLKRVKLAMCDPCQSYSAEGFTSFQESSKTFTETCTNTFKTKQVDYNNLKKIELGNLSTFLHLSIVEVMVPAQASTLQHSLVGTVKYQVTSNPTLDNITTKTLSATSSKLPKPVVTSGKPKATKGKLLPAKVAFERAKKEQQDILDKSWLVLEKLVKGWINTSLEVHNIDEIASTHLTEITNLKVPEKVKTCLKERLVEVKKVIMSYTSADICEQAHFENLSENEIAQTLLHPECSSLIFYACRKLRIASVISKNAQLSDSIPSTCISSIRQFYAEKFLHQLEAMNFRNISAILQLHYELASDLVTAFEQVLCRLGLHKEKANKINELGLAINNDFYLAIGQMNLKLQGQVKQIQSLIENQRAQYESGMDMLVDSTETVEASRLSQEHDKFVDSCTKTFQTIMAETFENGEPLDCHISALHFYFNKSFKSYGGEIKTEISKNMNQELPENPTQSETKQPETRRSPAGNISHSNPPVDNKCISSCSEGLMPLKNEPEKCSTCNLVLLDFSPSRLGISSQKLEEDFVQQEIQYFSDGIAVTQQEEWILFDKIERSTNSKCLKIQQSWKLRDCWGDSVKFHWSRKIKINGSEEYVGIEFLIAVWVKLVFRKYFGGPTNINEALICVPIWFTSVQRQQVVHAMEILGIRRSSLVNENSASAYFLYRKLNFPNYNIAVISEISGKIDMAFFYCNQQAKQVRMIAHNGDYYEQFVVKNGNVLSRLFSSSNIKHSGSPNENTLKSLHNVWTHALQQTEDLYYGQKLSIEKVVIKSESTDKAQLLLNFARQLFADSRSIISNNSCSLTGLAQISLSSSFRQHKTTERLIRDISAFDVVCKTSVDQEVSKILPKQNPNCNETKESTIQKKTKSESTTLTLCQQHKGVTTDLGSLTIRSPLKSHLEVKVSIQSSVEGRFKLPPVKYYVDNKYVKLPGKILGNEPPKTLEACWELSAPKQEIIEKYAKFVDKIDFLTDNCTMGA